MHADFLFYPRQSAQSASSAFYSYFPFKAIKLERIQATMRKFLALLFVVILLAACAAPAPSAAPAAEDAAAVAGEPVRGGQLVRAMTGEPAQIDPQGAASSGLSLVLPYLFDTLVIRDVDNSIHPLLAESWESSDDDKTITMKLKPGVVFQDGTPLNAEAVKFTFERFQEKGMASPIYSGIREIAGIEAVDDLTVRFTFDQPAPAFWSTLTMPYAAIISPTTAQTVDAAGEGHQVGTGPFKLGEWLTGQSLTLVANPDYTWGPGEIVENTGAPYLSEIVFKVIPDATTQLAALEAGEVDVIFVNQPAHLPRLAAMPGVVSEELVLNSLIYLGYNAAKPPFDEPLVRQALAYAVDKAQIVDIALGGLGKQAFAPLPPTLPGFDASLQENELGYDPEQAKTLLQEAGFTQTANGGWERDGVALKGLLLTSNRAPNEAIATLIQSQLQAIGVPVEIQQLDSRAVMDATTAGAFDLLLWRFEWSDPDGLRIFLGSDAIGGTNRTAYSNPEVDALLNQAAHETDEAARAALYLDAQKLILADAPWQPLYNPVDVMAMRAAVHGIKIGYMGRMLVNDAWVEQ
jgi:peptide/nickel transport system substrate-binding protein